MSDPGTPDEPPSPPLPTGSALLQRVAQKLSARLPSPRPLFRVVEVVLDRRGRLVSQGQIWHSDLTHVRRFGRAVAANSMSQRVEISDAAGAVLERIPVVPQAGNPAGWGRWHDQPLPPLPALGKTARPRLPPSAASAPAPVPPRPLLQPPLPTAASPATEAPFDPEATATLAPAPPR